MISFTKENPKGLGGGFCNSCCKHSAGTTEMRVDTDHTNVICLQFCDDCLRELAAKNPVAAGLPGALLVFLRNPTTRAWLEKHDPMAAAQAIRALRRSGYEGLIRDDGEAIVDLSIVRAPMERTWDAIGCDVLAQYEAGGTDPDEYEIVEAVLDADRIRMYGEAGRHEALRELELARADHGHDAVVAYLVANLRLGA